jgi:hypothetical protein
VNAILNLKGKQLLSESFSSSKEAHEWWLRECKDRGLRVNPERHLYPEELFMKIDVELVRRKEVAARNQKKRIDRLNAPRKANGNETKPCQQCGILITTKKCLQAKFCGHVCAREAKKFCHNQKCKICGGSVWSKELCRSHYASERLKRLKMEHEPRVPQ